MIRPFSNKSRNRKSKTFSLSESLEQRERGREREQEIVSESDIAFTLQTAVGALTYKSNNQNSYTDFVCVAMEMMLAFNFAELDPDFRSLVQRAIRSYQAGDSLESLDDEEESDYEEEENNLVQDALNEAKNQALQMEAASTFISNLPAVEKLKLQILSTEDASLSHVNRLLSKHTDLPPNVVHEVMHNHKPFVLPFTEGTNLYVQLRMSDVILSIKPATDTTPQTQKPTKKSSAGKTNKTKDQKSQIDNLPNLTIKDGIMK